MAEVSSRLTTAPTDCCAAGARPATRAMFDVVAAVMATVVLTAPGLDAQVSAAADSMRRAAESAPLFASHDVLDVRIEAPFTTIFKDRSQDSEYQAGTFAYVDGNGDSVVLDMRARTRGFFRLQRRICDFPNLHINFRRRQVEGTLFAGQNRVSIVAHCQDDHEEYEQFTLQEYLIYRTFNLLTDRSVRVRLARATYVDTDGERPPLTRYMFILEPFEMLAARHGWDALNLPSISPDRLDPASLLLFEVFQFMIGNTDWSSTQVADGGQCCHNARLIGSMVGSVIPVPYDFDWSGVISAPYARPEPQVGVRRVRDRRYWGICRPTEEFAPVFDLFNQRRAAIYDLWRGQEDLDEGRLEQSLEYFDEFYEIINDPDRTQREILQKCRKVTYR